ncbi:MAG: peptidyl-prolyl cis-trans isomerase [Desulfobulbaceae bacterium]|nr:peptidyl-prolyl cis-trans isomerase [Desulfobulbaceae bacterium]
MKISVKKLWREPLIHFLLIGAALFVFYGLTRDVGSEAPNRIEVNSSQVEQLAANFKRTWMRPPTEDELNALVENYVREEVFYREALAMGLDQNDPLVRRRMRMKLEFILEDLSSQNVTDEVLTAFLEKHPDKFRTEAQLSFQQVFLNPEKRKDLAGDAEKLVAKLNDGAEFKSLGDPILVPFDYSLATQSEIARSFGERFAADVIKLTAGDWTGPVYSAYGGHLLKVSERVDAHLPKLADIRELVKREYLVVKRKEQKDLAYKQLREGYEVTIEAVKIEPVKTAQAAAVGLISSAQAGEAQ